MEIKKAYDLWAAQYDSNRNKTRDLDITVTIQTLEKYSFSDVIELGCGTGKNTGYLLTRAERIIAIDFSPGMLAKAKQKVNDPRVQFVEADLHKDWRTNDFTADLITCNLVLEHIEDLGPLFGRVVQKLQQGGHFFICELHPAKQYMGSKANFETETGIWKPTAYVHHLSDYLNAAQRNKLELVELEEWFDEQEEHSIPRLISFVFRKS